MYEHSCLWIYMAIKNQILLYEVIVNNVSTKYKQMVE